MPSRDQSSLDLVRRSADQPLGSEHLFHGRDVVSLAGEQEDRHRNVVKRKPTTKAVELASGKAVLLGEQADRLPIIATGQIDRMLTPALEALGASQARAILDMLVMIDELTEVMLARMHILPALACVRVDRCARKDEAGDLVREAARIHRRPPPALAQADEVSAATEIVDSHTNLGQVLIDVELPQVLGNRLPVRHQDTGRPCVAAVIASSHASGHVQRL